MVNPAQKWKMDQNSEQSVNFQGFPELRRSVSAALEALATDLENASGGAQLAALCDTRALHRRLFAPLLPEAAQYAAGVYRGTMGTRLERLERAVFISRKAPGLRNQHHCAKPQEVADVMGALALRLDQIWNGPRPSSDQAFADLAEVSYLFLHAHPYMDGNGHIFRLILPVLARRLGLHARAEWTLHPRPYDHLMSLCLQWYPHHPGLLACYLRQWFSAQT